jgi:MFS family permease
MPPSFQWRPDPSVAKIPKDIWVLGFVSMLADIASEMIHSLLPVFLVTIIGASAIAVGVIEGVAEATALIVKVFSGTVSDYLGRRKMLAVIGYGLSGFSKPLFAIAGTAGMVLTARFLDRIGKGIRGAPRDALVADITPPAVRGAAYGLRQALDTVGAFVGPLLAVGLMLLWANDFRAVFWVAVIPGLLAAVLLLIGVQEPDRPPAKRPVNPIHGAELRRLGAAYWWVVGVGAVFTLARFSEAFLVLRAQQSGLGLAWIPMVLVVMNIAYAASAYPFGKLSDGMSHKTLLAIGLVLLIAADVVLAAGDSIAAVFAGIVLWGLHMGATQGLLATMVADGSPTDLRGTAFGVFSLVAGLMMLLASLFAGILWELFSPSTTFIAGAVFSTAALIALVALPRTNSARP